MKRETLIEETRGAVRTLVLNRPEARNAFDNRLYRDLTEALAAAGVQVRHLPCRGQIHTSLTAVDVLPSGAAARAEMGATLRGFFGATVAV